MTPQYAAIIGLFCTCFLCLKPQLHAQDDDQTGVKLFRLTTTNLYGTGIHVAQAEAEAATNPPAFEVNPANVGSPAGIFKYLSANGTATSYPNTVGTNSGHAESVAKFLYGTVSPGPVPGGVATNLAHVDVIDANYFINNYVYQFSFSQVNLGDPIINQSFDFPDTVAGNQSSINFQESLDMAYDNYAAQFNVLFLSSAGTTGTPSTPGTAYNSISVASYNGPDNVGGDSATGPTVDNGRCKPEISAPDQHTSFAIPQVAGSAAVLMQAGLRGDGGPNTNAAVDIRTLKALLLNGAVKQSDWTNGPNAPLDARFGAGMLNLYNSYRQLAAGRQTNYVTASVSSGAVHPPTGATNTVGTLYGWDFTTNTSSSSSDVIHHYYFNVTNSGTAAFLTSATLVWNRHSNASYNPGISPPNIIGINNLRLYLYNTANSNLVICSTSAVNNVQHIYLPKLAPGRYDLQVWKAGGSGIVSTAEPYALAFAFMPVPVLSMGRSGTNVTVSWPAFPAGYLAQATTNLLPTPVWSTNNLLGFSVTNQQIVLPLPPTNQARFFRLNSPNF